MALKCVKWKERKGVKRDPQVRVLSPVPDSNARPKASHDAVHQRGSSSSKDPLSSPDRFLHTNVALPRYVPSLAHSQARRSNRYPREGSQQSPALGHSTGVSRSSIDIATFNLPNLFEPQRFNAVLSGAENRDSHNEDEHFSPMLLRVLSLLDQDFSEGAELSNLLERTMEPFGKEYCQPAFATVMATVLLSVYLLQHQPRWNAAQSSLITPSMLVQDLLGKSCWLSRHSETLIK